MEEARKLGHSPKRRKIPRLAWKCYRHFRSFNEAKKKVGLPIVNVRVINFPKNAFKLDKDMARIVAHLTTDGHLYNDLKGFMYFCKDIKELKKFEVLVKRKFGNLREIYHLNSGRGGITHKIYFFNKKICKYLFNLGIPKGDKVIKRFGVPKWISSNKEFSSVLSD